MPPLLFTLPPSLSPTFLRLSQPRSHHPLPSLSPHTASSPPTAPSPPTMNLPRPSPSSPLPSTSPSPPPRQSFSSLFPPDPSSRTIYTSNGTPTDLPALVTDLAVESPVVVAWLRHFGCTLCTRLASQWRRSPLLRDSGAAIVLVGCGSVEQLGGFVEETGWKEMEDMDGKGVRRMVVTDPGRGTYGVLGWERGWGSVLDVRSLGKVVKSFGEGNRQRWKWKPTDATQQGGLVVVGKGGDVIWIRKEGFAGDHVEVETLANKLAECK